MLSHWSKQSGNFLELACLNSCFQLLLGNFISLTAQKMLLEKVQRSDRGDFLNRRRKCYSVG